MEALLETESATAKSTNPLVEKTPAVMAEGVVATLALATFWKLPEPLLIRIEMESDEPLAIAKSWALVLVNFPAATKVGWEPIEKLYLGAWKVPLPLPNKTATAVGFP